MRFTTETAIAANIRKKAGFARVEEIRDATTAVQYVTKYALIRTLRRSAAKVRATFHLPEDLVNELRDAVVALSGPPERLTLADLAETALRKELERFKRKHNKGKPFPRRKADLKGGRPIK